MVCEVYVHVFEFYTRILTSIWKVLIFRTTNNCYTSLLLGDPI